MRKFSPYPALLTAITVLTYRGLLAVEICWLLTIPILFLCYLIHRQWHLGKKNVPGLKRKAVLITGCDSGFGQRLALRLHSLGVRVYAGCLTEDGVRRLSLLSNLRSFIMDITKQTDIDNAKKYILSDMPLGVQFWCIVNNAAISGLPLFELCWAADYKKVMEVNFFSQIAVTEAFLPLLKRSHGRVVTMTSMAGRTTIITGPYTCSKQALDAYMDGLRRSLNRRRIKVSSIEPGWVPGTGLSDLQQYRNMTKQAWDSAPDALIAGLRPNIADKLFNLLDALKSYSFPRMNKVDTVVDSMCHAVCSASPRQRYTLGWDTYFLYLPLMWLPDAVMDYVNGY